MSAAEWPGLLAGLDAPGLYAWWVDGAGAADLSRGLQIELPAGRVYLGQAGAASSRAGVSSASTLRSRVGSNHLGGRVCSSTLRRTLASILLAPLELVLVGPRLLVADSEERLTAWMRLHLSIAVFAVDSGDGLSRLEKDVVKVLQPPLNIEHMPPSPLRTRLRELRAVVLGGLDDLWRAPDPTLTDWRRILGEYGQAFDGHRYAELVRHRACADVAEEVWQRREAGGRFASSFADLRCALFWLQRWVHNAEQSPGWEPDEELQSRGRPLYAAIQAAWTRERGVSRMMAARDERAQGGTQMTTLLGGRMAGAPAVPLPSAVQLESAAAAFDADWGGVDEVLYELCRKHADHAVRRDVTAKVALIDRVYSAGFERRVTPPAGKQAITVIADFMLAHAAEIDDIVGRLAPLQEPLAADDMVQVVAAHGRLMSLLQKVATDGKAPRSFAAKYLHFHCPVVPIYDSYAAARLIRLVHWDSHEIPFEQPSGADDEYWDFCVRCFRLYEACHAAGLAVSVKRLDTYLWAVPGGK